MNTPRSARRLAGLTTGGLLAAGLTCLGTAPATAATSDPLGFDIAAFAVVAPDAAIAIGSTYDDEGQTPHAALVRDGAVTPITGLPAGGDVTAVMSTGSEAVIFGSDADNATAAWSVAPADAGAGGVVAQPIADPVPLDRVTATAKTAGAPLFAGILYDDETGVSSGALYLSGQTVLLGEDVRPEAVAVAGGKAFVVGTAADGESGELWVVDGDAASETYGGLTDTIDLGTYPDAVAATDQTVFVADTVGDEDEVRVIDAATGEVSDTLTFGGSNVRDLATSADAATLYAAAGNELYAIPTDDVADFDIEDADSIESEDSIRSLGIWDEDGHLQLFGAVDVYDDATETSSSAIVTFGAPEKPVVTAKVDAAAPTTLEFTVPGEADGLHAKVTSAAGKVIFDGPLRTFGPADRECSYDYDSQTSTCWIEGLAYDTTYTLVVTATNFLGSTESIQSVSTLPLLAGPSSARFTGTAQVGKTLTAVTSTGWPAGANVTYGWGIDGGQWGDFVAGRTLTLTPALAGTKVTLIVTGAKAGFANRTAKSAAVTIAKAPAAALPPLVIKNPKKAKQAKPTVSGTPKVGRKVTATVKIKAWPKGTTVRYQWYADGKPIKGATKKTLKLTKKLKGKKVQVVATGTKPGYAPATKKSKPVRVR